MHIVLVRLSVKPEFLDAFLVATLEMAHAALEEEGTRRFEVIRQEDDASRFVLYQAARSSDDHTADLASGHVKQWLASVEPMLVEPPQMTAYTQLF